jgi:hypothetical protein
MTILFILIAVWLLLGVIGSSVVFVYDVIRVLGVFKVRDLASAVFAVILGLIVFMMALSTLSVGDFVIYKRK